MPNVTADSQGLGSEQPLALPAAVLVTADEPLVSAATTAAEPPQAAGQAALVVLAVLAVIAAIYVSAPLLLPILVAAMLAILLNPIVVLLSRRWVPRWLAATLVLISAIGGVSLLANVLYEPAMQAARDSPRAAQALKLRVASFAHSFAPADAVGRAMDTIDDIGTTPTGSTVVVLEDAGGLTQRYGGAVETATTVGTVIVLVFMFLVYGERLFRQVVIVAPTLSSKRNTVAVVRGIQSEVSRYVGMVSLINVLLGGVVALALHLLGVKDPLLWGGLTTLLNFAPYIGPVICLVLLVAAGLLQFENSLMAWAPAAVFLVLNVIESELVTPMVLGRNFSLNPVVILVWLLIWGWLWGIPGVLLGTPLLVCGKIICLRSETLRPWAQVL